MEKNENSPDSTETDPEEDSDEELEIDNVMCQITPEYVKVWLGDGENAITVDTTINYFCLFTPTDEPLKINIMIGYLEGEEIKEIHNEVLEYDTLIQIMPYIYNFFGWEKEMFPVRKCKEQKEDKEYGEIECYNKPIIQYISNQSEEGKYLIQIYRTTETEGSNVFLIQGVFLPFDKEHNHCIDNGKLRDGIGLCGSTVVDEEGLLDQLDDDDFDANNVVTFIY